MTLPPAWDGVLRQLLSSALALFVSSIVVFSAMYAAPGDTLRFLSGGRTISPEAAAEYRVQFRLDEPFLVRYWRWLSDVSHGDFGRSLVSRTPVTDLVGPRIGTTLLLMLMASVLMIAAGVAAGTAAGLRPGKVDGLISAVASIGLAIPAFVASALLVAIFAVGTGWFPAFGAGSGFLDRIYHLILPATALAISGAAYIARVTRVSVRTEIGREHVETAFSRGLSHATVIRRHVLRNTLIPVTTVVGLTVAGLIAGSVVVESAFGLDGLGSLLISSVIAKDFAVVQAVSLMLVVGFLLINMMVDLLYVFIDPRLRSAAS
jgi:peptide/nickel transport system permease protein